MTDVHPPRLDGDGTRALLSNLAHLHRFVLAYDLEERIAWMSDALAVYAGGLE